MEYLEFIFFMLAADYFGSAGRSGSGEEGLFEGGGNGGLGNQKGRNPTASNRTVIRQAWP